VGPDRVVVASPALDDELGLAQSVEDLAVEQLIAKAGVEAHGARREEGFVPWFFLPLSETRPPADERGGIRTTRVDNEWCAVAKIAGLELCQVYRRRYGTGLKSLMPTNLYGPGGSPFTFPLLLPKSQGYCAKSKKKGPIISWYIRYFSLEPLRDKSELELISANHAASTAEQDVKAGFEGGQCRRPL
jgi:NAD dependent epimerase/dehydratase family